MNIHNFIQIMSSQMRYMNPYQIHKALINEYILKKPGDHKLLLQRDTSKDKRDIDVIREHHRFLWDDEDKPDDWERQFARKYYDKLFKEYCIADLSHYKENKIALRWRIEQEVVIGKGQFICGNKHCQEKDNLKTWEVNFAYIEDSLKKNALVKIRLCSECSKKLNYKFKKKEVKRLGHKKRQSSTSVSAESNLTCAPCSSNTIDIMNNEPEKESPWKNLKPQESKTRDEEMEEYLQDLLL